MSVAEPVDMASAMKEIEALRARAEKAEAIAAAERRYREAVNAVQCAAPSALIDEALAARVALRALGVNL